MKKFAFAAFFTIAMASFAFAEEFFVTITKVDSDKGTITYTKGFKGKKKQDDAPPAEPVTVKYAKTVKVATGKKDDAAEKIAFIADEDLKDGFKHDTFTKATDKGVLAFIKVADDGPDKGTVTQVLILPAFGKKKGGQ